MTTITPLIARDFARYGDVIEAAGAPDKLINQGKCQRFHDLARIDCAGPVGVSLFRGQPYALPLELQMMERHPLGSQLFMPLSREPFLVIVADDDDGKPEPIKAFLTEQGQGVNILRGVWHGVLTPLLSVQDFLVVDYVGPEPNLEEHWFETPVQIRPGR